MRLLEVNLLISIVDDDESVRDSTTMLLRSAGYEVQTFASADHLLNSGSLGETECLILDIQMPGTDGLELQRQLWSDGHRIPIIFITAYGDDLLRQRVINRGALDMLNKPFEAAIILAALEKALSEARCSGHLSRKRLLELAEPSLGGKGYVEVSSVLTADESAHLRECSDCIDTLVNIVRGILGDREQKKSAANE